MPQNTSQNDRVQEVLNHQSEKKRDAAKLGQAKKRMSLRIDEDVIQHFMSKGENWEANMNAILRKAAGL